MPGLHPLHQSHVDAVTHAISNRCTQQLLHCHSELMSALSRLDINRQNPLYHSWQGIEADINAAINIMVEFCLAELEASGLPAKEAGILRSPTGGSFRHLMLTMDTVLMGRALKTDHPLCKVAMTHREQPRALANSFCSGCIDSLVTMTCYRMHASKCEERAIR